MRFRSSLTFVFIAAVAGCTTTGDTPTGVLDPDVGTARFDASGVKPPPPLGSEETDIQIDASLGFSAAEHGPNAAFSVADNQFHAQVEGRYFANTQSTNAWIDFESNALVVASKGARLQYNEKTGRTNGHGTLTDLDGTVLDLSLVTIISGHLGGCNPSPELDEAPGFCGSVQFTYGAGGGGSIEVNKTTPLPPPEVGGL